MGEENVDLESQSLDYGNCSQFTQNSSLSEEETQDTFTDKGVN